MPSVTPNGPTLNDLMYGGYNPDGYLNVTTKNEFYIIQASEFAHTAEVLAPLNYEGFSFSIDTSDFLNTNENVQVFPDVTGPNLFSLSTSDSVATTEAVTVTGPYNPSTDKLVVKNDKTTIAENPTVTEA